jgi:hypothetical protein
MTTYTASQLRKKYEGMTGLIRCHCHFTSELVGGVPADEKALLGFAEYHLKIVDPEERARAVQRILKEEVGEREVTPEAGEITEKQIYGVNVIRRTDGLGPWLGDWMLKGCIKQAASRVNIFTEFKSSGAKGNFAEAGQVRAIDYSLKEKNHPDHIYVVSATTSKPARTSFREFMGRVQSAQGPKSIIHHSECVAPGSRFAFEFRFMVGKVKKENIEKMLAMLGIIGCGSVRSMERGKYEIDHAEMEGIKG